MNSRLINALVSFILSSCATESIRPDVPVRSVSSNSAIENKQPAPSVSAPTYADYPNEVRCGGGPCFLNAVCMEPLAPRAVPRVKPPFEQCEHSLPPAVAPVKSPPATYFFSQQDTQKARQDKGKSATICCYRAAHYAG